MRTDGELLIADSGEDEGVSLNDGGFESSVKWRFGFSRSVAVLTVVRGILMEFIEYGKKVSNSTFFPNTTNFPKKCM